MRRHALSLAITTTLTAAVPALALELELAGSYASGLAGPGKTAAETVAVRGSRMYVTHADDIALDIVDISDPATPRLHKRIDLSAYGAGINSVDVSSRNLIAVAVEASPKTDPGTIVFLTPAGQVVRTAQVGALPDMVVFTADGRRLLVANEGEPDCYGPGCTDPEGSISVIDVVPLRPVLKVTQIGFEGIDVPEGVRIFGPSASVAQDLEPEYITLSEDSRTAWVSLQENNAIAELDLDTLSVIRLMALGYKDHGLPGNGLDASDRDNAINIRPWMGLFGMYQPDAIASVTVAGETFLLTANEGDARDWPHPLGGSLNFNEEIRASSITPRPAVPGISSNAQLGRLTVTRYPPAGDLDNLYVFGARSLSVWDAASGAQVWDSGDELEQMTAEAYPANFNSNNSANTFDDRSDNKGPEPEGVAVGEFDGRLYAFVGLERIGGLAVYEMTDPRNPQFAAYLNNRDFSTDAVGPDSGAEVVRYVSAANSPNGRPMVVLANETSGTVSLWQSAE
jgi:hypothetical protein